MFGSIVSISIAAVCTVLLISMTSCTQEKFKQTTNVITACVNAGGSWLTKPTEPYGPTGCIMSVNK